MDPVTPDYPAGDLRVSDADRDRAISALSEHFQAGRLTADEFGERSGQALQSRTGKELAALFTDLPRSGAVVTSPPPRPAPAVRTGMAAPVLVGVLVSFILLAGTRVSLPVHPGFAAHGPTFRPLVLLLVVLFVVGGLARRRHRRDPRDPRDRWEQSDTRSDDRLSPPGYPGNFPRPTQGAAVQSDNDQDQSMLQRATAGVRQERRGEAELHGVAPGRNRREGDIQPSGPKAAGEIPSPHRPRHQPSGGQQADRCHGEA